MRISVSVVSYNSKNEIDDVLQSLMNSTVLDDIDIYVIDNASSDGTSEYVEQMYKNIEVIKLNKNIGYGGGHNKAIERIISDYHFIINPDIKFDPELIENMVAFLNENTDIALAIPKVQGYDGTENVVPRRLPTLRRLAGSFLGEKNKLLKKWRDDYYMVDADTSLPFDIDICSGCFMAIRTSALKTLQGFDERFFLYFEDFDLSRRLKSTGRVVCVPQFIVLHKAQRDGHRNKKSFNRLFKSMCIYFCKWGLGI